MSRKSDHLLIIALASGLSATDAAKEAKVSRATVTRRLRLPGFQAKVDAARAELAARTAALLTSSGVKAVATLRDLLCKSKPPTVRLGAARALLELAPRHREAADLEQRIRALEEKANHEPETTRRSVGTNGRSGGRLAI